MTRLDTPGPADCRCAGLLAGLKRDAAKRRAQAVLLLALTASAFPAATDALTPVDLVIHPPELTFDNPRDARKLLVLGILETGERIDLTSEAEVDTAGAPVARSNDGYFSPTNTGSGSLTIQAGGLTTTVPVTVGGAETAAGPVTFVRDVLPAMNKVGCSNGTCHGAAKGKNGFKLSLRGYDPEFDYQSLLYDMSGRRFNRAEPARSLMLAKPTMQVAHEGGLRLDHGSRYYNQILDWIKAGVPYGDPKLDRVERLEIHPGEVFMHRPGMRQQAIVIAHYGDGRSRDVTREAHVTSSNTETMAVENSPAGPVVTGLRRGESTLLVRYEGQFTTAPATVLSGREGFEWTALPQASYIDELIDEKLQRIEVLPSAPVDDAAFLRRASLDLTGQIPTPNRVRAFLADDTPTQEKRNRLVDELIASDAYVDHWTLKWGDLLRSNRKFMSYKGMLTFRGWLREAIEENRPYDELVRELVTASGSTLDQPAASYFRAARDPKEAMETTTQLFMGVRMVCAQCHDHPFERWTQNQYFEMTAFFAGLGVRPGFRTGEEIVFDKRRDNEQLHPKTNAVVPPKYLVPVEGAPDLGEGLGRRAALADWLTSPNNPYFAPAIANRVWSYFMGRGIIDPVDDIRASNQPVNAALLNALTADLIENDFDLRHLMRTITTSRAYQSSFQTNEWNQDDRINFSRHEPRRLSAEQLADAVARATDSRFEIDTLPEDFDATALPDPHVMTASMGIEGFLDLFGKPDRETACECERKTEMSLPQALSLLNGSVIADAIADPEGRVANLILGGLDNEELIAELYLAALGRLPTGDEAELAEGHFESSASRTAAAQDLMWALLNSNAFLFNS
ncbi:MAG: DUF1549 domain-containing protein [Holophagales bacterium]|nr:DUF1549 domain-containing protein [Holophagales bacterium]MYD22622.1 DUF1549 domain-containing protein [Holophagales bacterium]